MASWPAMARGWPAPSLLPRAAMSRAFEQASRALARGEAAEPLLPVLVASNRHRTQVGAHLKLEDVFDELERLNAAAAEGESHERTPLLRIVLARRAAPLALRRRALIRVGAARERQLQVDDHIIPEHLKINPRV